MNMKLSKEEKAKYEVQKVINAHEVEGHTAEGWTILESFEVEETAPCYEDLAPAFPVHVHVQGSDQYGIGSSIGQGLSSNRVSQTRFEKIKQVIFLVGKTKGSVLAEKQAKINELEAEVGDWKKSADVAKEEKKTQEGELHRERDLRRDYHDRAERNAREREEQRARAGKLELDIGKIRKAIGERQMGEILSADKEG